MTRNQTATPTRKLGLILECAPEGADLQVFRHVIGQQDPQVNIQPTTMINKQKLVASCGEAAQLLLQDGCERVIIAWDLYPAWREKGRPCRKTDRENIFKSLEAAGIPKNWFESPILGQPDMRKVFLVCIQAELEAWLLADEQALSEVLSRPSHQVRITKTRNPERPTNPKKLLTRIFTENVGQKYNSIDHAEKIIQAVGNLGRIARACPTFARFLHVITILP
jgi:hypothetical protein